MGEGPGGRWHKFTCVDGSEEEFYGVVGRPREEYGARRDGWCEEIAGGLARAPERQPFKRCGRGARWAADVRGVQAAKQTHECVAWYCLQTRKKQEEEEEEDEEEKDGAGPADVRRCRVRYPKDLGEVVRFVIEGADDFSFGLREARTNGSSTGLGA